jgi:hypothetical protein
VTELELECELQLPSQVTSASEVSASRDHVFAQGCYYSTLCGKLEVVNASFATFPCTKLTVSLSSLTHADAVTCTAGPVLKTQVGMQ